MKEIIDKLDLIKIKSICAANDTIKKVNNPQNGKNI